MYTGSIIQTFVKHYESLSSLRLFSVCSRMLFNILWACRSNTSKKAIGHIRLCANIAEMCVPSQIVSNCYTKILDILYVTKDRSL